MRGNNLAIPVPDKEGQGAVNEHLQCPQAFLYSAASCPVRLPVGSTVETLMHSFPADELLRSKFAASQAGRPAL